MYDALIIGGGPGGATAGLVLARAGLRPLIVEKSLFPRFHIGESLLPRNMSIFRELGLLEHIRGLPHMPKYGVEFAMGHELQSTCFTFDRGLLPGETTMNVERASFDRLLLDQARAAGAQVREGVAIKSILQLEDGNVVAGTDDGDIRARYLLDASGPGTVVGRHLGTRKTYHDPRLQKVAYFEHFENVSRRAGTEEGHPFLVMCEDGWFWLIPIDAHRMSIGLVTDPGLAKRANVPANQLLAWAMDRCPAVRARAANATGPKTNQVIADFSYTCKPYAGPGYFLIGDAAAFIDPVFSTGVTLSMMTATEAARHVIAILGGRENARRAQTSYIRFIDAATGVFFKLISQYYRHSFRELFLHGMGPVNVHNAVLSILAGHVFPKPPFALRWRLALFHLFVAINARIQLVPRRERFSLLPGPGGSREGAKNLSVGSSPTTQLRDGINR
jgi:flavin-dependent dehydrogenase